MVRQRTRRRLEQALAASPPRPLVEELPDLRELEDAPPLEAKQHPPTAMRSVRPTLDDPVRHYLHHPSEGGEEGFSFEPDAGDAAADLAGDLGTQFLEGATRGEDVSDWVATVDDAGDAPPPFLVEEPGSEDEEPGRGGHAGDDEVSSASLRPPGHRRR